MVAESKQSVSKQSQTTSQMSEQNATEAKAPTESAVSDKTPQPAPAGKSSGLKFHFGRADRAGRKERVRSKA
ncbi:MAG: hypothetical protein ACOYCB_13915, partial [Fastidiosipilaceae bacterium]